MLKALLARSIRAFERRYDYDMGYGHALLSASLPGFLRFLAVTSLSPRPDGVPPAAWYAAKIAATMHGDCGPCTQLVIRMAADAAVPGATLRAVVAHDLSALDADTALGLRYATAVLTRTAELPALQADVLARWGARGLASLALAVTAASLFPTLKVALGHGHACSLAGVDAALAAADAARAG
ncbi:MAG: hypothetical protein AB7O21_05110 [Gammaproteobacteria bacterium]